MNFWKSIATALKSNIPFPSWGGGGGVSSYNGRSFDGRTWGATPGAKYDYRTAAGDIGLNNVVAVCVDAIGQALADAPPVLEQREGDEWNRVDAHPIIDLLSRPNGFYSASHLWTATANGECVTGNAYWRLVWNKARTQPVEAWIERGLVALYDSTTFISGYEMMVDGNRFRLDNDEVVHFRHSLNINNPRYGCSPLETALRQIALDNGIGTHAGAIMRNGAVASLLVSAKILRESEVPPTPEQMTTLMAALEAKLTGEGAGRIAGSNLPVEVSKLGYSPDEMMVDKLLAYAESRICAALRVPGMVIGLSSGDGVKTYANYEEAIKDFWNRNIIPTQNRHAAELGIQLLPLFDLDPAEYRINWDRSGVAALQEDETAKFDALFKAIGKPFLTVNEGRAKIQMAEIEGGDELAPAPDPTMGGDGMGNEADGQGKPPFGGAKALPTNVDDYPADHVWTQAEIDANTDVFDEGEGGALGAYANSTPDMQALLGARPDKKRK